MRATSLSRTTASDCTSVSVSASSSGLAPEAAAAPGVDACVLPPFEEPGVADDDWLLVGRPTLTMMSANCSGSLKRPSVLIVS